MTIDNDMALAIPKNDGSGVVRPHWMKSKLPGGEGCVILIKLIIA